MTWYLTDSYQIGFLESLWIPVYIFQKFRYNKAQANTKPTSKWKTYQILDEIS